MTVVLFDLLLALAWTLMTGVFTASNFMLGMVIGALVLAITYRGGGAGDLFRRARAAPTLLLYLAWELARSNLRVARDMLRRTESLRPAVIDVPLTARSDAEIALLAACITLTPGSTAIALSRDRSVMYVHLTNLRTGSIESARRTIKSGFERRVLELLR